MGMSEIIEAVAIQYDGNIPKTVASGRGDVAKRIVEIAKENGIKITKDEDVVSMLLDSPLNEDIPEDMYIAVAIILSEVANIKEKMEKQR